MTTTTFATPPRNSIATVLQIATVAVILLLGAAFATSLFAEGSEEQLRAALAPPVEQVGS